MGFVEKVIQKKRSREWFCEVWKPQKGFTESRSNVSFDTLLESYNAFDFKIKDFASKHNGCLWAYAFHNRGVNFSDVGNDDKRHSECEHIHFVIKLENACSGSSLLKAFPFCHIDVSIHGSVNCANYLLHNTFSSFDKHKVPLSDLYCSGKGEHGEIWFPLIKATKYELFIPDNVLHYVYNENCLSMLEFMSRFGHSVCTGSYPNLIKQALEARNNNQFVVSHIKEIFNMCPADIQCMLIGSEMRIGAFEASSKEFEELKTFNEAVWFIFEKIYIWYHNSNVTANDELKYYLDYYNIYFLKDIDKEREDFKREFEKDYSVDI